MAIKTVRKKRIKYRFEFIHNTKPRLKQPFRWRVVAINGRIVCDSENFRHKQGPVKTVRALINAIKNGEFNADEEYLEGRG